MTSCSSSQDEEYDSVQPQSAWKTAWENNKGAALILISEAFGSSNDAIVRFLQQGGYGMHPFQARQTRHSHLHTAN